jgi:hypothetical protein
MQAILLIAHNNIEQVVALTRRLTEKFVVYLHIDKKYVLSADEKRMLDAVPHLTWIQEIKVMWGAWGISDATIRLMKLALQNPEVTYVHLLSGQDWPAGDIEEIYNFYENNSNLYMLAERVTDLKKSGEPIILWQKYYWDYDRIDRRTTYGKIYHRLSLLWQTVRRVDKFRDLKIELPLWQGPNWMDLPRDAVEYLLAYFEEHENIQKLFMTGFCSDEFWIQTILCNSREFSKRIVPNYHRYILWEEKHGSYPAILDEADYDKIAAGDYHFIRKVTMADSKGLMERLTENGKNNFA